MLKKQAHAAGLAERCSKASLTTTIADRINGMGAELRANTLTGQETLGSNDGSKNSTLVTYLTDNWTLGAEI